MSIPISIKNDLFRFVTVRAAQQLYQTSRSLRFVFHPDIESSSVFNCTALGREGTPVTTLQDYLATLSATMFTSYTQVAEIRSVLYDLSCDLFQKQDISLFTTFDVTDLSLNDTQVSQVFEQLFYQLLSRKSKRIREACIQLLVADHIVKNQAALLASGITKVSDIKVVIPQAALSCIKKWLHPSCKGELHGVNRLGIADFRRVEQEVCCYVPGEVSHIENVLGREYKERTTRNLVRTELTTETIRETEIEHLNDTTTATRNELSSEVSNVLEEDKSSNYGGSLGVSGKCYGVEVSANAYADFSNANTSSQSNTEAKTYAEEVTRRAVERILQKTTTKRTAKIIKEFEENNKHGFDNRGSDYPITGVLRWVDKIYTNRLINYNKRLMFEFLIPEPATLFKSLLNYIPKEPINASNTEPKDEPAAPSTLASFGITNAASINAANAAAAGLYFGVSVPSLPAEPLIITKSWGRNVDHKIPTVSFAHPDIIIPSDYEADKIKGSYEFEYKAGSAISPKQAFCDMTIGANLVSSGGYYSGSWQPKKIDFDVDFAPNIATALPMMFTYARIRSYSGSCEVTCVVKESVKILWQTSIYNQLIAAYNNMLEEYENTVATAAAASESESESKEKSIPSGMKRLIEQQELKRACIEMIMRPFCREMGKTLYEEIDACGKYKIPKVHLNSELDEYSAQVRFFEQAFDWQIMSYLFYPYYWADKCNWGDLFQQEDDDLIFQAFKQAGMAKVLVPVRPELSETVLYYLETGDIWMGGNLVAETEDEQYLSLTHDLKVIEGQVEAEWETRVPTTLTLAQQQAVKLEEGGLPCCHGHEGNALQINTIKPDTHTLIGLNTPPITL